MLRAILICSFLVLGLQADAFTCPKNKITINDGTTGSLPKGATSMVQFAKGTSCTFTFTIPKGFAIRMESTARYEVSPGDFVKFDYFFIGADISEAPGFDKDLQWAVGPELNVSFLSVTGNLNFFAQYTYVDLTKYTQVLKKTGDYFNTTLEQNKYYTVEGTAGDKVTWNLAMRDTGFYDHSIFELMMFDGPDIVNSEYIGRLTEYTRSFDFRSDSNHLTFLNLYGSPSDSFVLANDYSKVQAFPQYNVWVVDPVKDTTGNMYNVQWGKTDAYYTFICDTCDHFFINSLYFNNQSDANGYMEVQVMSPTQNLPVVLNYTNTQSHKPRANLPQRIPAKMGTFHIHKADVQFVFKADL